MNKIKKTPVCILVISIASLVFALTAFAQRPEIEELMYQVRDLDDSMDHKSNIAVVLIDQRGKKRSQVLKYKGMDVRSPNQSESEEMRICRFHFPVNPKNMAFLIDSYNETLNQDYDQWSYIPALRQVRRIANTEKDGAFISSDFLFSDMERLHVNEFEYKYLADLIIDKKKCYTVLVTARDQLDGFHKTFFVFSEFQYDTGLKKVISARRLSGRTLPIEHINLKNCNGHQLRC